MLVVFCDVVRDTGESCVNVCAAEVFGGDFFAGCGFDQGRAAEENGALIPDNDSFVGHCGDVCSASGA